MIYTDKTRLAIKIAFNAHEGQFDRSGIPYILHPLHVAEQMTDEINSCNDKIEKITGRRPTLFRAPYGEYDNTLIDTLSSMNMFCIQWSIETIDTKVIMC